MSNEYPDIYTWGPRSEEIFSFCSVPTRNIQFIVFVQFSGVPASRWGQNGSIGEVPTTTAAAAA